MARTIDGQPPSDGPTTGPSAGDPSAGGQPGSTTIEVAGHQIEVVVDADDDLLSLVLPPVPPGTLVGIVDGRGPSTDGWERALALLRPDVAAVAVMQPVTDAIKRVAGGLVSEHVDRASLRAVAPPILLRTGADGGGSDDLHRMLSSTTGAIVEWPSPTEP